VAHLAWQESLGDSQPGSCHHLNFDSLISVKITEHQEDVAARLIARGGVGGHHPSPALPPGAMMSFHDQIGNVLSRLRAGAEALSETKGKGLS
jgi:hypothetical protein